MHAVIATCLFLGFAASLIGCRSGPGYTCPAVEGPTKTIDFTTEGEVLIVFTSYDDFDVEVTTTQGSTASVTVQVAESLEKFIEISYNDFSAHNEGRKELYVGMTWAYSRLPCPTGVKVTITLPAPASHFYGTGSTSTVDILTKSASSAGGSVTVGLLSGTDTSIFAEKRGQIIVNSVQATRLSISTGDTDYLQDTLNGATLHVLGGEVSDSVSITQKVKKGTSIELNDLTTQNATIDQYVEEGSLTGMRSQTCSINWGSQFGQGVPAGTITTDVNQAVDCTVQGQYSAEGKITITGDAAKTGSCFESAQDAQALV